MVWILQCLYHDQVGTVRGSSGTSRPFDIRQGVRQGCVLSPRLFACVLQWALRSWRARVEHCGLDFEDGMAPLLDLRFADDLLLFAVSKEELIFMLEQLIGALQEVGLVLNASKTFVLTTEAQPPTSLRLWPQMVGMFSDNKKCTRTDLGCGTSFAKRCSGMVRAQVDVVRQEHSAGFTTEIFQCCYHSSRLFCSRSPNTLPKGRAKVRH